MSGEDAASVDGWPPSALWRFSLDLYARPGVEQACLELQDGSGLDVNLVLAAAWLAATRRLLRPALADALRALGDRFQAEVTRPLRCARRAARSFVTDDRFAALIDERRRALLAVELDFEHLEQLQLEARIAAAEWGEPDAAIAAGELLRMNLAALYPDRALPDGSLAVLAARLERFE